MPTEAEIRKTVRDIIMLQEKINVDGGTCTSAQQYRWLLLKQRRLLQALGLPYTSENLRELFSYPLSPLVNITDPCNVNNCPHMERKMLEAFVEGVICGMIPMISKNHMASDIRSKVNDVISNIVGMTGRALE
jgi:hypothetical protein